MTQVYTLSDPRDWIDLHGDYLFRYALLRVHHIPVAEDLVQDTLLAALQSRHGFAGRSPERFWLLGILKHKLADYFRSSSLNKPAEEPHQDEWRTVFDEAGHWRIDAYGPQAWVTNPGIVLEQKEFWQSLAQCLGEVPPRQAHVYTLREVDGLSSAEICRMLELSQSNLWVILHRVRLHLRRCLETKWIGREVDTR